MKEVKRKKEKGICRLIFFMSAIALIVLTGKVSAQENQDQVFEVVDVMPQFPGGNNELMLFLSKNIKYPTTAIKDKKQGRVVAQFVVAKDGSIINPIIKRSVDPELDKEALRLIGTMPKWTPGKQKGQNVNVRYTIPIVFRLPQHSVKNQAKNVTRSEVVYDEKTGVYEVVENMPEFPGGQATLMKYLAANIKYPADAVKDKIQGRVIVQFVVDKTGKIINPKIVRSVNPSLDQEALRVISGMPLWTPGTQKGEKVDVKYTIPVNFNIP